MEDIFFTLYEVSDKLKVAYLTVYRWVQDGKLKAYKIGRQYRVKKEDLDAFIQSYQK